MSAQKALKEALEAEEAGSSRLKSLLERATGCVLRQRVPQTDRIPERFPWPRAWATSAQVWCGGAVRCSLQGRPPAPEPDPDRSSALSGAPPPHRLFPRSSPQLPSVPVRSSPDLSGLRLRLFRRLRAMEQSPLFEGCAAEFLEADLQAEAIR